MQKLYRFDVDQSIRIEELAKDSIIGIANKENFFTLVVPSRVKRRLREEFRKQGKPKQFGPQFFASAIVIAMQQSGLRFQELIVDTEYPGYEREMSQIIASHFRDIIIHFSPIGRKSPAHYAAYGVHIKKKSGSHKAGTAEILQTLKYGLRTVTPLDRRQTIRSPH